jgi:hypothetical protein
MGISCEFGNATFDHGEKVYECSVKNKHTPENRDIELSGYHEENKGNYHVNDVAFTDSNIVKIPQ